MHKKLLLFMTSLSLAAAPVSAYASEYTGPAVSKEAVGDRAELKAATGEYRSWKQWDSRWGNHQMSPGYDTLSQSGCLVTAIATLMVHSGCADESGVDPGKLNSYLVDNGGYTGSSELYWYKINGAVDGFSLANWSVSLSGSRADKVAQIESYLNRGYYVVVSVGYGAHWVAVDSSDGNGNINIFDPAYSYTKLFGSYSEAGVDSIALFSANGSGGSINGGGNNSGSSEVENYSAKGTVNVGASYLNVRTGIGTDKGYLKDDSGQQVTLRDGQDVTITGKGKDSSGNLWYRISVNGRTGYVYGAYIEISSSGGGSTSEGTPGKVNASSVNIRSGPGTHYAPVGVAQQGKAVTILGEENSSYGDLWYKVDYEGTIGYIHSDYVDKEGGDSNGETTYPEKSAKVNASSVNVRSDAGTGHSVVATLKLNDSIKVIGEKKDSSGALWYKIKYNGGEGYMHSDYVTIGGNSGTETTPQNKKGKVNGDVVNVRSGAGTNYSRVTSLNNGTEVKIVGEKKDSSGALWYKIEYNGGSGYMIAEFITIDGEGNGNSGDSNTYEKKQGAVNASSVNVRSGAGTNHSIVGNLSTGTSVTIVGEEKDSNGAVWYKIEYSGGSGYMISDYISIGEGGNNQGGNNTYEKKNGKVNGDYVNVRSGAGTNHSRVTSLNSGTAVTIIGEEKDSSGALWYKIQYAGGSGYMIAEFITIEGAGGGNNGGSTTPPPTTDVIGREAVVNTSQVNVRTGAGSNHGVMNTLNSGVSVLVEAVETDSSGAVWYKVAFAGTSGYVLAEYVTVQ